MKKTSDRLLVIKLTGGFFLVSGLLYLVREIINMTATGQFFLVSDHALWALVFTLMEIFTLWLRAILSMQEQVVQLEANSEAMATKWLHRQGPTQH